MPVNRIYARYQGMDAWLGTRPFAVSMDHETHNVTISYRTPELTTIPIDDRRNLVVAWTSKGPSQSNVQTRIGIQALPWLGVEYNKPVTPDDAFNDAAVLGEMLTMFLGAPTTMHRVELHSPEWTRAVGGSEWPTEIAALGARFRLPESLRKWSTFDVLLPFATLETQFPALLAAWFRLRESCWSAIVPYIARQRSPSRLAESRFFDFASVVESLHRHCRPEEKRFSDIEAQTLRDTVLGGTPRQYIDYVRSAMTRINDLSYKERLLRVMQRIPSLMADVIGGASDQEAFAQLVRGLRDTEAHRLKRTKKTGVGGSRLVRIAAKLKVMLDAWILAEIGVDPGVIEAHMRNNRRYWFYACNSSWSWKDAGD